MVAALLPAKKSQWETVARMWKNSVGRGSGPLALQVWGVRAVDGVL